MSDVKPDNRTELDIETLFDDGTAIDADLKAAVREAVRRHKLLGQPIVEWRDGRVVLTPPDEIVIDDEPPV